MSGSKLSRIARRMTRMVGKDNADASPYQEDIDAISRSGFFDRAYYMERYPDVAASNVDPVEHYVKLGAAEGRNPSASFDTRHYMAFHPDVAASGMNPFRHFCDFGHGEGRSTCANDVVVASEPQDSVHAAIAESGLFDAGYYLRRYPEAAQEGVDSLWHYVREGWSKGYNPNPWFDSGFYLKSNPDVANAGMNPLFHFSLYGWKELRSPSLSAYDLIWHWLVDAGGDMEMGNPMAVHVARLRGEGDVGVRTNQVLSPQEMGRFAEALHSVLAEKQLEESQLVSIGKYASVHKAWSAAEEAFHALVLKFPDTLGYKLLLAEAVEKQGRVWQLIDVLEEAVDQIPENADLVFRLGDAKERMGRYAEAATDFAKALALNARNPSWHYRHGYALERAGRRLAADAAYAKAGKLDKKHGAAQFGVGVLHQERGLWKEAAVAYAAAALQKAPDAELWYRLGFARDRCYDWAGAAQAYRVALSLDFKRPYWHYRLGLVLERQGKWQEAAGAYRTAADMDAEHRPYWYYRCGYVFEQSGQHSEACVAYLMTNKGWRDAFKKKGSKAYSGWLPVKGLEVVPDVFAGSEDVHAVSVAVSGPEEGISAAKDEYLRGFIPRAGGRIYIRAEQYHAAARLFESHDSLDNALASYKLALERSPDHVPAWHFAVGRLLAKLGRHVEACEAFRQSRILKRPYGVDISKYEASKEVKALMEYNEYHQELPIQKGVVLYESFLAASIGCNPYAIFRHIVERPEFSGWKHVWVIDKWSEIPAEYAGLENVIFIPRNCDAYRRYLATAEYLINNVTFPYWFSRRDGQKYLNTWHGTPLKGLGKDMKGEFMAHGNVTRNFLHATHLLSPNAHTSDVMMKRYDVDGLYSGKFAETGYPRVDQVVRNDEQRKRAVLEELGLTQGKPVVLYAPTWRGAQGRPETDSERLVSDVTAMVGAGFQLVFRGHHFMEAALAGVDLPVTVVPQHIDTCDLLSVVDVLVTDYSSILFDFLPAGRPIVYYAYDLQEYAAGRGFYFDMSELPGSLCTEVGQVREAIEEGLRESVAADPSYLQALSRFCPFEDGNSTRRAVEFFFHDSNESVVDRYQDSRKSILMYNGMFPANGITSSYLNLVRSLESMDVQVATLFEPSKIRVDPVRVHKFESMPGYVKCIAREGRMVLDPEEIWINSRFESKATLENDEMWGVLWRAYEREYRRLFGGMKHDAFVNFEGYNALTAVIAAGAPIGVVKTMYMHNDMISERNVRLPYMNRLFHVYGRYDHLVSVSSAMNKVNSEKLRLEFFIGENKFTSCDNTIDIENTVSRSLEELDGDLVPWFDGGKTFLTLGRMSPEKDHAKLMRAFAGVLAACPDAKLVLLGDGPLKQDLSLLINELGIADNVKLAGLRMNPFPALKACGCFVLSSNHEGQPMVLLEAMTLGKPIIATDIDGNRGVLGEEYGELVDNSEDGLRLGMKAFLDRGGRSYSFSSAEYQHNAVGHFKELVLGA